MSPPIPDVPLQGREAYVWAWLLHGPRVRCARWTVDPLAAQLYPATGKGWERGRQTFRAANHWAEHASAEAIGQAQHDAIFRAPVPGVLPTVCEACRGTDLAFTAQCRPCNGTGVVHAYQEATP
jgi:hypothetical protein